MKDLFGEHSIPIKIIQDSIRLVFEKTGNNTLSYQRDCDGATLEKILLSDHDKVYVHPIEPLNLPRELSTTLLLELEKPILVQSGNQQSIYLTFPIEIGVFIKGKEGFELLDVMTLTKPKFTLYGDPSSGTICKYWNTPVYDSLPTVDPIKEGILKLKIRSSVQRLTPVHKFVFNAFGMKIYFDKEKVCMKATARIMSRILLETEFEEKPVESGMTKAIEQYSAKKLSVTSKKFTMEGEL